MTQDSPNKSRSLWMTPVDPGQAREDLRADDSVTRAAIEAAVERAKDRVAAFSGRVSDEALRATVE